MNEAVRVQRQPQHTPHAPKVEIGCILFGAMEAPHRDAAQDAAERMRAGLAGLLPEFDWHMTVVERDGEVQGSRAEPVLLLDEAELERDRHGWDFVFVVTQSDLVSYARPVSVAAPSRILSAAVLSTARLADDRDGHDRAAGERGTRLYALLMHLFGRLNGLDATDGKGFMRDFDVPSDLDGMDGFDADEVERMRGYLETVADLRVEEMRGARQSRLQFYVRSLWENRRALPGAIQRMRPWSFPARLSRLTTAAGSALVVLMMTAESWEVAANLTPAAVVVLCAVALVLASAYLIRAQRLLARRDARVLREQRAVSNVSTVLAVCVGMAVTWFALFATAVLGGYALFHVPLLAGWVGGDVAGLRLQMAGFTAALSIAIGALGASFEPHGYFRHVTHIDDEL